MAVARDGRPLSEDVPASGVRHIDGFNARVVEAAERGEVITRTVQSGFDRETGEGAESTEEQEMASQPLAPTFLWVIVDEYGRFLDDLVRG